MAAGRVYGPVMTSTINFTAPATRPFLEFGQVQADTMAGLVMLAIAAADDALHIQARSADMTRGVAARRLRKAHSTHDIAVAAYRTLAEQWPTFGPERP
jgi:hypothetical protein